MHCHGQPWQDEFPGAGKPLYPCSPFDPCLPFYPCSPLFTLAPLHASYTATVTSLHPSSPLFTPFIPPWTLYTSLHPSLPLFTPLYPSLQVRAHPCLTLPQAGHNDHLPHFFLYPFALDDNLYHRCETVIRSAF